MSGKKSIGKSAMWVLMGLLILGLGGFGVTNLGGNVRSIGSVGESDIGVTEYARMLRDDIRAEEAARREPVSFAQAQELQIDQIVLARLIAATSLEEEARLMGVSIGDANLAQQIRDIPAFQGIDGSFDREAYRFQLEQTGLTEGQFEEDLRAETARTLLQGAVVTGIELPEIYTDALMLYIGEERTVTWAMLDQGDLITGLTEPDEQDLIDYHQSNLPDFTTPEVKKITYAWLTPEMIIDTVEVDEDTLRALYDDRSEEFNQPERRLVERLAFPDSPAAEAALARVRAEEASFDDLVTERGLDLADVDLGDVSLADLGAAGEAVFAAEAGDVVGPLETAIGPALFRINGVLQAQTTSFEEAEPQLRDELAGDRARRVIDAEIDGIEDLLAGGATVEDLAKETDMQLAQIDWHPGMTDAIGAYDAFRSAAAEITTSDYPEVEKLDDDGIFAMRLEAVVEPEIQPLDAVRAEVEAGWRRQAVAEALSEQVAPVLDALRGGAAFADHGMPETTTRELTRRAFLTNTPADFIETVYDMSQGDVQVIREDGRIFVLRLDTIAPPAADNEELTRLRAALSQDANTALAQDLFQILANDIRSRTDILIDQQALNAVHSNFQ
ncbi:peptidylprolyl isomerase [Roseovarius faecimaris]|uniref:Parvulin-like PPIase n=1 Tax=Roseovarius faecimaris TaxID=2494550 RepID=A0A6I6IS34_9RHOB|nr:peptidyl-prolyl cis-trans isomerase [Roseovarius faecimaris]QGX98106.1 peptidylprolyl isomerase [Roseovarius faecimaris]